MPAIPEQYISSLVHIKSLSWKEVFDTWRNLEAWQESWKSHWVERGFDSWDEWRTAYVAPIHPETLVWELYQITDPIKDLPLFYGTPTKAWIEKAYDGETTKRFRDIDTLPIIRDNDKVLSIKQDFPRETMLTGLVHDGRIILVEGMHRGAALTTWNPSVPFTGSVTIALAEWNEPIPRLGGNYKGK